MTILRSSILIRSAAMLGAAAVTFALVSPASAASDPAASRREAKAAKASAKSSENPNVVYCVEGQVTGSRIHRPRVCKSRDQWIKETGIDPITE